MLRRFSALLLAIACACAPVMGMFAAEEAADCCCGAKCPCPPMDRGATPTVVVTSAPVATASLGQRADARKPSARSARAAFAPFISHSENLPAPAAVRRSATDRAAPAASVALFQAHCSLLL